jgi:hypothetical protein
MTPSTLGSVVVRRQPRVSYENEWRRAVNCGGRGRAPQGSRRRKRRMRMRRHLCSTVATLTLLITVALPPGTADARTALVTPDRLQAADPTATLVRRAPDLIWGSGEYFAVVHIPVGRVIKRLLVSYTASPAGFEFQAQLHRKKPGAATEDIISPPVEGVAGVPVVTTYATEPGDICGPTRVAPGYVYFVTINLGNTNGNVWDLRVVYE